MSVTREGVVRVEQGSVVETGLGRVRGIRVGSARAWLGIPFAAPPVGAWRFRAPQPVQGWEELDAGRFGAVPVQLRNPSQAGGSGRRAMSEDCLTLNVYVPDRPRRPNGAPEKTGAALPVIVWIYGGAFTVGAGANHKGERLAEASGAVVVTLNYRLGALGFMDFSEFSTPTRPLEGNLGLLDQIAALQWVSEHIGAFGGDPGNVTIMGESAGAISVLALMCSPRARGLFHRAIAQSPAPGAVVPRDRAGSCAREFVGFLGTGTDRAAEALENASPEQLVAASEALAAYHQEATPGLLVHAPVVDGDVLPRHPAETFEAGEAAPVPLLIGTNDNEGRLFQMFRLLTREEMIPTSRRLLDRMFALTDPVAKQRILAAYPRYPASRTRAQVIGDMLFWAPTIRIADAHSRRNPTFVYRFDQSTPRTRRLGIGATHASDLAFVFGELGDLTNPIGSSREARLTSARMMRLWGRFAAEACPDRRWPVYDETSRRTMIIDDFWRVESDPRGYRHRAWEGYRGWR